MTPASLANALPASFRGEAIAPEDARYADLCLRHNRRFEFRPALILQPRITEDVIAAVNLARECRLPISVKCGGLHPAGRSSNEGGLVLDMGLMRSVTVNPTLRSARVGGGALGGDLQVEASRYGLGAVSGILAPTGLAGAILHGGFGLLSRKHGWGCDNVLSFDVVTGDGTFRTVTPQTEPELDWAMRGAGSSFGVVTSMLLQLHEAPPAISLGSLYYPAEAWTELLPQLQRLFSALPEDDGLYALVKVASAEDGLPDDWTGRAVIDLVLTHFGDVDSAWDLAAPFLSEARAIHVDIAAASFRDLHFRAPQRASSRPGRQAWDEEFILQLTPELGRVLARAAAAMEKAPGTAIMQIYPRRSGMARPPPHPSSCRLHEFGYTLSAWSIWDDAEEDPRGDAWIADFISDVQRAGGNGRVYLNAVSQIDSERARHVFGEENFEKLMLLKGRFDPDGLFRGLTA